MSNIEKWNTLLGDAYKCASSLDTQNALLLCELVLREGFAALENKTNLHVVGSLKQKASKFFDDNDIINACKLIDDAFDPALEPTGFDGGTSEPVLGLAQCENIIGYTQKIIERIDEKLAEN